MSYAPQQYPPTYPGAPPPQQYVPVGMAPLPAPGAYPPPQAPAGYPPPQQATGYPPAQIAYQQALPPAPVMQAPVLQHIDQLCAIPGVVIKEKTQALDAVMEAIGGAYESQNKYYVYELPADKKPATDHGQPGTWVPSGPEIDQLKQLLYIQEESDCCLRVVLAALGGLNLRALKLHAYGAGVEHVTVDRPCRLGAGCCCPLEMTAYQGNQMVGKVEEDCDNCCYGCWECCCLCTCTHKVLVGPSRESLVHKYSLRNYGCCCGRVNNCCGGTCCKQNFFIDIVEPDGKLASVIQQTYGSGGCEDCCRCTFDFNNYVLPFPRNATGIDRAMLITALLSIEYAYHSRTGGENNDN